MPLELIMLARRESLFVVYLAYVEDKVGAKFENLKRIDIRLKRYYRLNRDRPASGDTGEFGYKPVDVILLFDLRPLSKLRLKKLYLRRNFK